MKTLGPVSTYNKFIMIDLEDDKISLIKLGYEYAIKSAIAHQIGFFSKRVETIENLSNRELKSKYQVHKIYNDQIKDIYIEMNKYLAHKLIIDTSDKKIKLNIDKREEVEEYQNIIQNWKKNVLQHYI